MDNLESTIEERSRSLRIRLRSFLFFSRLVNFLVSLTVGPFTISAILTVAGFFFIFFRALASSQIPTTAVLVNNSKWFMPLWYMTWHLFFVMALVTAVFLTPILLRFLWWLFVMFFNLLTHFFWNAIYPDRPYGSTPQQKARQLRADIDEAATRLAVRRAREARPNRPVLAKLLYKGVVAIYLIFTYYHFYNLMINTTGTYFAWGLNSWHP